MLAIIFYKVFLIIHIYFSDTDEQVKLVYMTI